MSLMGQTRKCPCLHGTSVVGVALAIASSGAFVEHVPMVDRVSVATGASGDPCRSPIVRHRALDLLVKPVPRLARQPVLQFEISAVQRLQMRRDRVQRRALGEVEPTDCPPGRSALGGSGRAAPRRKSGFDPERSSRRGDQITSRLLK
jgi:hypothetical protein